MNVASHWSHGGPKRFRVVTRESPIEVSFDISSDRGPCRPCDSPSSCHRSRSCSPERTSELGNVPGVARHVEAGVAGFAGARVTPHDDSKISLSRGWSETRAETGFGTPGGGGQRGLSASFRAGLVAEGRRGPVASSPDCGHPPTPTGPCLTPRGASQIRSLVASAT